MPSRARLDWNGDRLIQQVRAAAVDAINDTVDAARDDARATHAWNDDPKTKANLELEIQSEHADPADTNPTARFGYTKRRGFYGLFHEEGTVHEHEYPALRPAADRTFPTAAARLKEKLSR